MRELALARTVAGQQLTELLRVVHGRFLERVVPFRVFTVAVALGLTVVVALSTLRAAQLGDELSGLGMGVGLSMQILTLVVQNTFPGAIVGTALVRALTDGGPQDVGTLTRELAAGTVREG